MPSYRLLKWNEPPPESCRGGAITVGNFDGVHLGHAKLTGVLREQARLIGGPALVLSFDPHPLQLLAPERFQPVLTAPDERAALLKEKGADEVVLLRTTPELLQLSPDDFVRRILHSSFRAKCVVEGFNFRYGRDRAGDIEQLRGQCNLLGMTFVPVPAFKMDGSPVSSSRVRRELLAGNVCEAARLLARNYSITGVVGMGQRRGMKLGFPTANLHELQTLLPAEGVYAVRVEGEGRSWLGAANIGPNPTFGENARKVEVHLLDFNGDLYGRRLRVEFVERIRDTKLFANVDELVKQLRLDVETVRALSR
ncbi:MAG TPA: bifunctional riboflavin kinase/FAD synthetase [Gemmataceae bacterium]|nr:bifunctional riboflavin kinase/FAD synthetase [Gemmataceae bacterium]